MDFEAQCTAGREEGRESAMVVAEEDVSKSRWTSNHITTPLLSSECAF